MTKPGLMAGASRFAHYAGLGRRRRAADGNDEGEEYGNRKDGRKAEDDDDRDGDEDETARRGRKSKRAEDRDDDGKGDKDEDSARRSKKSRADDDEGDDADDGARKSRKSKAAEDDEDEDYDRRDARRSKKSHADDDDGDDDEDEEREMNGRSAVASGRRRERRRCCAILEAAADAMGNPALLESALTQMESTHGTGYAVRRIQRAARAAETNDRSESRARRNPNVGSDSPPSRGSAAEAAKGWGAAIAKVVGQNKA
ncbi:MAG: hypothetical protein P4L68_08200 [Methylovirgula sp.]|nr:hypothetical protein [Methylovirgula sp.]